MFLNMNAAYLCTIELFSRKMEDLRFAVLECFPQTSCPIIYTKWQNMTLTHWLQLHPSLDTPGLKLPELELTDFVEDL